MRRASRIDLRLLLAILVSVPLALAGCEVSGLIPPPDPSKLQVTVRAAGTPDTLTGLPGAVRAGLRVLVFEEVSLQTLLAEGVARADGSFGPLEIGDDRSDANDLVYVVAAEPPEGGKWSAPTPVWNPKTPALSTPRLVVPPYTREADIEVTVSGDEGAARWLIVANDPSPPSASAPWLQERPTRFRLPAPGQYLLYLWIADSRGIPHATPATASVLFAGPPSARTSSISVTGPTLADGTATATVTIRLLDAQGNPVAGETPLLQVSGGDNRVVQPSASDMTGTAIGRISSTRAETKLIVVLRPPELSSLTASAEFVAPPRGAIHGKALLVGETEHAGLTVTLSGATSAATTTDATGAFSFLEVVPGSYTLTVVAPSTLEGVRSVPVLVESGATTTVPDLYFTPVGDLIGRAMLSGRASGHGGISIHVVGTGFETATDDDGNWRIRGVPAGLRTVMATLPGYGGAATSVTIRYRQTVTVPDLVLAKVPPDTILTGAPPNPSSSRTATFWFTATDPDATFVCSLNGATPVPCTSPHTYLQLQDGTHRFEVTAVNQTGPDPTPATYSWAVTTAGPPSAGIQGKVLLAGESQHGGITVTLSGPVASATTTDSSGSYTFSSLLLGTYTVTAVAPSTVEGTQTVAVTVTEEALAPAPDMVFSPLGNIAGRVTRGGAATGNAGIAVAVSGTGAVGVTDDAGAYLIRAVPTGARTLTASLQGYGTATTSVLVRYGQTVQAPEMNLTRALPDTILTGAPANPSRTKSAVLWFTSDDPTATFTCALDGGAAEPCTSPHTYQGLADGVHTVRITAVNDAGPDPTPATFTWTIDTAPPQAQITSKPSSPTNDPIPRFAFTSNELGSSFVCRIDGGAFFDCASPFAGTSPLPDGEHRFAVLAIDPAGNAQPLPLEVSWVIDTGPPDTTITLGPPDPSNSLTPTFGFSSTESGSFRCSVDSGPFVSCSPGFEVTISGDGPHRFEVAAVDEAGNVDPTPAVWTWRLDTQAPETSLGEGRPPPRTRETSVTFTFTSNEPGSFICRLTRGASNVFGPAPCSSPFSSPYLSDGNYIFSVYAVDEAGNSDPTPETHTWEVDTTPPPPPTGLVTAGASGEVTASWNAASDPHLAGYRLYRDGTLIADLTATTFVDTGLTNYEAYGYEVSAYDDLGNESWRYPVVWGVPFVPLERPAPPPLGPGGDGACVTHADGSRLWCWGANWAGQLGDAINLDRYLAGEVRGVGGNGRLGDVVTVSRGANHTCAVKTDGSAYCWGNNNQGQLGDDSFLNRNVPVQVVGPGGVGTLRQVTSISAGYSHTCAVRSDGTLWCWGYNGNGQLGTDSTLTYTNPVQVKGPGGEEALTNVAQVAAGAYHTCAARTDGTAWCWGYNGNGQLGDGTNTDRLRPVQVRSPDGSGFLTGVLTVATSAQGSHTCALRSDGTVLCWGANGDGQLGNGSAWYYSPLPVFTQNADGSRILTRVTQISAGSSHTCALRMDGDSWCWGSNGSGELGDGTTTERPRPVQVQAPTGDRPLEGAIATLAGSGFSCAVLGDGQVLCWGTNWTGQLGNNALWRNSLLPGRVEGIGLLTAATSVSGGLGHTCVVVAGGALRCWGYNDPYYQLGDGTGQTHLISMRPRDPAGTGFLVDVASAALGSSHSCAARTDGTLLCWGNNSSGQLGDNTNQVRPIPVLVRGPGGTGTFAGAAGIAAGLAHSCASTTEGALYCWGDNSSGQLGDGTTTQRFAPRQVVGPGEEATLTGVLEVAAGYAHTCARRVGGVWCWGYNGFGQLGNGTNANSTRPVQVLGVGGSGTLSNVVALALGTYHSCAVGSGGEMWCWGQGGNGELGNGTFSSASTPVQVKDPSGTGFLSGVVAAGAGAYHTCAVAGDARQVYCWGYNGSGQVGDGTTTSKSLPVAVQGPGGQGTLTDVVALGPFPGGDRMCAVKADGSVFCWGSASLGDGTQSNRTTPVQVRAPGGFLRQ